MKIDSWIKLKYLAEQTFSKEVLVVHNDTPTAEDVVNYPESSMNYDWYVEIKYGKWSYIDDERFNIFQKALKDHGFELVRWTISGECEGSDSSFYLEIYCKEVEA